jgi:hypothetical protein
MGEALYSSCFKIPEAAVNLQRRALGKRNNVKRLFKGGNYSVDRIFINHREHRVHRGEF